MSYAMPRPLSMYLDIVRFLAALVVFLGHASTAYMTGGLGWQLAPYGDTCVVVFFVLSGYVIGHVVNTKDRQWQDYAANRAARLWSVVLPALLLTALVDLVGIRVAPALYDGPWFQSDQLALRYLASALMLQEVWHAWLVPGINGPFWSLTYETFYYAVFGVLSFARSRVKWLAGAALLAIGGPLIAALFPIWALGYVAYKWGTRLSCSTPHNGLMFGVGLALLLLSPLIRAALRFDLPILGDPILGRYIDAMGIFLNLIGAQGLSRATAQIPEKLYKAAASLAGATFALYLLHRPLIQFFSYVGPNDASGWPRRALLIGGTLLLVFVAVPLTESLRRRLRISLLLILPRKISANNTPFPSTAMSLERAPLHQSDQEHLV